MKKILIITQNFYPEVGSGANRLTKIAQYLTQNNMQVTVLTTDPNYPNRNLYENVEKNDELLGIHRVIRIETKANNYTKNMFKRLLLYLEMTRKLLGAIRQLDEKTDAIFITSPPIFMAFVGWYAKRKLKKPLIADIRDLWPDSLAGVEVFSNPFFLKMAYKLEAFMYRISDAFIINSEGFLADVKQKISHEKPIAFMPNSLCKEELEAAKKVHDLRQPNQPCKIIYAGNLGLAQNIHKFLDLAEEYQGSTQIEFEVMGYGAKAQEIQTRIENMALPYVKFIEGATRDVAWAQIEKSDIAYVTLVDHAVFSHVLPGKIVDYMAMGKPILGDLSGYGAEIIRKANCGFAPEDRSVESLRKALNQMIEAVDVRKMMEENGRKYAADHFSWEKNIHVLLNILKEMEA
ncbi:MAG: glycosyltransferase family 4 protein [Bacillales bacterium]|nr:glycosyltransferase family 4 protein [Bacillales bacterium]